MPRFCGVVGCGHRGDRDRKSFFRLPAAITRGTKLRIELSRMRKQRWLIALRRADLTERKIKWIWICEDHFIYGKPAELYDLDSPDWVPSVNMGYNQDVDSKTAFKKLLDTDTDGFIHALCKTQRTTNIPKTVVSSACAHTSNDPIILSVRPAKVPILSDCSPQINTELVDS